MGMNGDTALTLAKNYVKKTLQGQGALKGQDGFSPIIEENADNTDKVYKLDITTADSAFTTPNLRGKDGEGSGGGEANVIESISVNGTPISVDENKNVDITVPSIDGLAKTEDIPTKVSELTNDSGYLTEHQDISGKVDKVEGKSLISDTEIARLTSVDNYDDTDIRTELANKADTTAIPSKVSELTNDSNYQTAEQVNSTVVTEISKVVADAPEDLNTLKEMSDWIAGHENDASAMNSAILDNKTAITALQTGKADKSEIPTELPANGGNANTVNNHTVKSDVPENAVFTDTIYDDTEVKGSIEELSSNLDALEYGDTHGGYNIFKDTTWVVGRYMAENGINDYPETGSAYSDYISIVEPNTYYISSFTHPKSTVFEYDANKSFIKYNGWKKDNNTPCVLSGNCAYIRISFNGASSNIQPSNVMLAKTPNLPYEPYIPSVKMLAEEVSTQNDSLSVIGKCKNLLKPTLQTTEQNGVTCTNNGDGTYVLNGKATSTVAFYLISDDNIQFPKGIYKTICSTDDNIRSAYKFSNKGWTSDNQFEITQSDILSDMWIKVPQDYTCDNVIVKPMIVDASKTPNATYDDFVPYTGDGDTLMEDVASINNDLGGLSFSVSDGTLSITDGTNTWTLPQTT